MHVYTSHNVPQERRPKSRHVDSVVQSTRRHGRLDQDPIRAIQIFTEQNPERTYMSVNINCANNTSSHRFWFGIGFKLTILQLHLQRSFLQLSATIGRLKT